MVSRSNSFDGGGGVGGVEHLDLRLCCVDDEEALGRGVVLDDLGG